MAGGDPSADPSASTGGDSSAGGGYTIEITVTADGQISVGVESADQESAEESGGASGGADTDSGAVPAKSIKDALTMALQIYKSNGQAPQADTSDQDIDAGYGAATGG
jgi:membrane protease subunit (stomatin/prohibitin family)